MDLHDRVVRRFARFLRCLGEVLILPAPAIIHRIGTIKESKSILTIRTASLSTLLRFGLPIAPGLRFTTSPAATWPQPQAGSR
jgi:hypothetical protein